MISYMASCIASHTNSRLCREAAGKACRQAPDAFIASTDKHTHRHTHLDRADGVEKQWRWVGQDHMPKVGVRQAAPLELETHKMGGGLQIRGAQLLTKC